MPTISPRLDDMDTAELRAMAAEARAAANAAPALREVLEPVADAAEARLQGDASPVVLPERLTAEPHDVIVDQREAMARAIVLRDDDARPGPERAVWEKVVERLAHARRAAKDAMAERRRSDPSLGTYDELIASREAAERADADFAVLRIRDEPDEPDGAHGTDPGRDEPAPWSRGPGYPGDPASRGEPADTAITDKLVEGTGYAGGPGGIQNPPADTGLDPGTPSRPAKDPDPPDVATR